MSIAKYYPFNGERGRLRLGLSPIPFSEWLQYENDFPNRIKEKKHLTQIKGKRVLDALPESIEAQKEYLSLLLEHIKKYHANYFEVASNEIVSKKEKFNI